MANMFISSCMDVSELIWETCAGESLYPRKALMLGEEGCCFGILGIAQGTFVAFR